MDPLLTALGLVAVCCALGWFVFSPTGKLFKLIYAGVTIEFVVLAWIGPKFSFSESGSDTKYGLFIAALIVPAFLAYDYARHLTFRNLADELGVNWDRSWNYFDSPPQVNGALNGRQFSVRAIQTGSKSTKPNLCISVSCRNRGIQCTLNGRRYGWPGMRWAQSMSLASRGLPGLLSRDAEADLRHQLLANLEQLRAACAAAFERGTLSLEGSELAWRGYGFPDYKVIAAIVALVVEIAKEVELRSILRSATGGGGAGPQSRPE